VILLYPSKISKNRDDRTDRHRIGASRMFAYSFAFQGMRRYKERTVV